MLALLADPQAVPTTAPVMAHWIEAAGLVGAIALSKFYDAHMGKKKDRNASEGLDRRMNNILQAVNTSSQSTELEFGKLNGRIDTVEGAVKTVATEVKGLRDRELERLEADAGPTRRRRRA